MSLSFRQAGNLFVAGPNISIYPSGNTFAISGSASGSTTGVETITTIGNGEFSIASSVTNNNLVYRALSAAGNFGIVESTGTLTFTASSSSSGIISGTNIGTGTGVFCGLTTTVSANDTMRFANLLGGPNFSLALNNDGEIFVDRGSTVITSFKNVGDGTEIFSTITTNNRVLVARTLSGVGFNVITAATDVVSIRPTNTTASRFYISDSTNILTTNSNFNQETVGGGIGIGTAASVSSRLLIAAGSATQSQIRLTKFATNITSPIDGDIWYQSSGNTLKFQKSTAETDFIFRDANIALTGLTDLRILEADSTGTISSSRNLVAFGVFNAISSLTIANIIVSSSTISNSIAGSQTLLSSTDIKNSQLIAGKKYRFNARGTIQTHSSAGAFNVNFRLGSVVIASSATFTLQNSIPANSYFEIDTTFTIKTQGTGGTVNGSGKMLTDYTNLESSGSQIKSITSLGDVTLDTTASRLFDCHVTFTTASTNNRIVINESTLEFLN